MPKGRFWIGKSDEGSTGINDFNVGVFGCINTSY